MHKDSIVRLPTTRVLGLGLMLLLPTEASAVSPYEGRTVTQGWQDLTRHDKDADVSVVCPSGAHAGIAISNRGNEVPALRLPREGRLGEWVAAHLHGFSAQQISLFWNGVPLHQLPLRSFDLTMLSERDDARIEVYRGSSPLEFGQGNIAGIIAIEQAAPAISIPSAQVGVGSFSTDQLFLSGPYLEIPWLATATAQTNAGRFTLDSDVATAFLTQPSQADQRLNNDMKDVSLQTRLRYQTHEGRQLEMFAWGAKRAQTLPGAAPLPQFSTRRSSRHEVVSLRYLSHVDLPAPSRVRAQVYVARNTQDLSDPNGDTAGYPLTRRARSHTLGTTHVAHWTWGQRLRLTAMGQAQFDTYKTLETRRDETTSAERWNAGLGAQGDISLSNDTLHLMPTVRIDAARDVRQGCDVANHVPGMRLGVLKYVGPVWMLRANISRDGRLATPYERWGDAGRVLANRSLRPERSWGLDVGSVGTWEVGPWAWRVESTAFATRSEDLIAFARTSIGQARAYNLGQAQVVGLDGGVQVRFRALFQATAHLTWLDARDTSDSPAGRLRNRLPMRPDWQAFVRPQICLPLARGWSMRSYAELDANSDSYLDPANLARTPERIFLHAGMQIAGARDRVLITLAGRNLTNARAFDIAGNPMTGRGLMLTTRVQMANAS